MTNTLVIISLLTTNWYYAQIRNEPKEIGIVHKEIYAHVVYEKVTNKFLIKSEPLLNLTMLRKAQLNTTNN